MRQHFNYQTRFLKSVFNRIVFQIFLVMMVVGASAKNNGETLIDFEINNQSLSYALKRFSNVSGYKVNFSSQDVAGYSVSIKAKKQKPIDVLEMMLNGKPFDYRVNGKFITIVLLKQNNIKHDQKAEVRYVRGKVIDENGNPLVGANIKVLNTNYGAIANVDGNFSCRVPENAYTIEVSFIGMQTEKVSVKNRDEINVTLHEDRNMLGDVVVTGYQKISKERSTAAFGFVDSKELNRQMHADLSSSLEGKIAGLQMDINPNTGEMSPILRGVGTFSNEVGTMPLIVIDDMPTNMTLNDINPYNVESITVLKDAAAASIYGALAANGVIVVTTKQAKDSKANINVNADWFITTKPGFDNLRLASSSEIIDYQTMVFNKNVEESGSIDGFLSAYKSGYYNPLFQLYQDQANGVISNDDMTATLNKWRNNDYYNEYRDKVWRTSLSQRYNISISQKVGENNHYVSFGYNNDKGRLPNDRSDKFSLYYKSNYKISSWLNVNIGLDASLSHDTSPNSKYTSYTIQQRYENIYNEDGTLYTSPFVNISGNSGSAYNGNTVRQYEGVSPFKSFGFNVVESLDEGLQKSSDVSLRPFFSLEAKFLRMFKYNLMYQYEWNNGKSETYDEKDSYIMRMTHNAMIDEDGNSLLPEGGRMYQNEVSSNRYTFRNQIDFDKTWKKHTLTAIAGLEFRENKIPKVLEQLYYGYDPQTLTFNIMNWQDYEDGVGNSKLSGNTITLGNLGSSLSETRHRYASFYSNANYSFNSRYNISGSIRWDYADLFGLDIKNQKHPLWSVGGSWAISEENFMKNISWINYLKLRATYGINGNVDQSSTTYFIVKQKVQSNPIKTDYLSYDDDDLPNPRLRWEKTATLNTGLDFRLFNNIINGSIEYYNRYSSDLLVRKYMDPTIGAKSRVINNGEMRNQGVELSISADIVRHKDWNFGIDMSFAHNANKIMKVDHDETASSTSFILSPTNYFIEGTSYNTLWAYRIDRIENGYPVAVDKDGNDLISFNEDGTIKEITSSSNIKGVEDLVNMGTLTPKFNGSFTLRLSYRNFDVNAFFVFAGGHKMRKSVVNMNDATGTDTREEITNTWSEDAPNENVRMYFDMPAEVRSNAGTLQYWWQYGDVNVVDAGYAKLRNISIGYSLPDNLCKKIKVSSIRIKAQVSNLFTWAKAWKGIDPESYSLNSGTRGMALPKTYSIGFTTSF